MMLQTQVRPWAKYTTRVALALGCVACSGLGGCMLAAGAAAGGAAGYVAGHSAGKDEARDEVHEHDHNLDQHVDVRDDD
jgi:hypothetical protein